MSNEQMNDVAAEVKRLSTDSKLGAFVDQKSKEKNSSKLDQEIEKLLDLKIKKETIRTDELKKMENSADMKIDQLQQPKRETLQSMASNRSLAQSSRSQKSLRASQQK